MSVRIALGGPAREAAERVVARLVDERIASRITAQDESVLPDADLSWTEAIADAVPLVDPLRRLQHRMRHDGIRTAVIERSDGAALAAAMLARTAGGDVVAGARSADGAVFVATAGSGSFAAGAAAALADAGADASRLVVLGGAAPAGASALPLDGPPVTGAYGALTAASLVPAALAGADLREVLDEAESEAVNLAIDAPENNGLLLGAALAAAARVGGVAVVADGTHIVGFPVWAAAVLAETPGLDGAVALTPAAGADGEGDPRSVRLVEDAAASDPGDDILLSGTLGELVLVWEYAATVAAVLLAPSGGPAE